MASSMVSDLRFFFRSNLDSLVILLREIVQVHQLVFANKEDLAGDEKDPLRIILNDLGEIPKCPPDDETEVQIELVNRFEPQLSKLDRKKNLKSETSYYAQNPRLQWRYLLRDFRSYETSL